MPTFDRDGVAINYEVHGSGPAVLLTHGYSATLNMWRPQIDALSKTHTLITWDMRGHGHSASPADPALYSEAHTTADMAALLDHLGFATAIIGGLSLGGYMSLAFHADYPERTEALLIIDTGPGYKNDNARAGWNKYAVEMADDIAVRGVDALSGGSAERSASEHADFQGLAMAGRHMLTQHSDRVIQSLPDIRVPSLVIVGEQDEPFIQASRYMADKIPDAQLAVIADAGHAVNLDQPAAFNAVVSQFLAALAT